MGSKLQINIRFTLTYFFPLLNFHTYINSVDLFAFFYGIGGRRADVLLEGKRFPPPLDTRNTKSVTSVWDREEDGEGVGE